MQTQTFTITVEPIEGTNRLKVTVPEIGASCETTENTRDAATDAGNQLITAYLLAQQKRQQKAS